MHGQTTTPRRDGNSNEATPQYKTKYWDGP